MHSSERAEFVNVISAMAATFGREGSEALLTGYWMGLSDLSVQAVKSAAHAAIHHCKFMPVPAELRQLAGELLPADRAVKAWQAVIAAVRRHGYYQTVDFDDPLTNATLRNLWHDWSAFDDALEAQDEHWLRKEFERVYQSLVRSSVNADAARPLVGWFEKTNRMNGHIEAVRPPVRIACDLPPCKVLGGQSRPARITGEVSRLASPVGVMPEEHKA